MNKSKLLEDFDYFCRCRCENKDSQIQIEIEVTCPECDNWFSKDENINPCDSCKIKEFIEVTTQN